jgi:hypothetical protein
MIKRSFKVMIAIFLLMTLATSCAVFKGGKRGCGCPSKKGMVGY